MKTLAWLIAVVCMPISVAGAQNQSNSAATDNEPVMYTLTIDEEMIKALREGQSLMSTIPPSIRGKVDRIRIEFKASNPPASGAAPTGNSILNRPFNNNPSRSTDSTGLGPPSNAGQAPPLRAPDLNGFQRTNSPSSQELSSQLPKNPWDFRASDSTRSTNSLTPIDSPRNAWLMGNRNDSNAVGVAKSNPWPASSPQSTFPLNRSQQDSFSNSEGLYSGPPAASRSLPALDGFGNSIGISSSPPASAPMTADHTPSFSPNQVVSKPPAESDGRQLLASADAAEAKISNRNQVYIFMLLLCSLGLNVYLGWIARGFYVRYDELASELRETFTPSNAA